jgi:vanillate O-demethylase ferredoxin subunit
MANGGQPSDKLELVIARRTLEAEDIISLELKRPDGGPLPPFDAGAHVDVYLDDGQVRQYSLCGDPGISNRYRLGILREAKSRGGSLSIHRTFLEARTIRVGLPRNNFPLANPATNAILFAGGIGVTPLLAMAYRLHRLGATFTFHYCTRSAARTAFRAELEQAEFRDRIHFHFDDQQPGDVFDVRRVLSDARADTDIYVCGPEGFMAHVLEVASALRWPAARVHTEYFSRAVDPAADDVPFTVVASRSGITVEIGPGQTIAQQLLSHNVPVELACEQGICGTCLTDVLAGVPDHRDIYQTDEEKATNRQMTVCCSRARTRLLVLDI